MKMEVSIGYKLVFWGFIALTVFCYIYTAASLIIKFLGLWQ